MNGATTILMTCDACGKLCADGTYYFKEGKAMCVACTVQGIPSPTAHALAHDAARKQAERAPQPQTLEAAHALELLARRLAVKALEKAEQRVQMIPLDPASTSALDDAERLVKLASDLDIIADKVFARGA